MKSHCTGFQLICTDYNGEAVYSSAIQTRRLNVYPVQNFFETRHICFALSAAALLHAGEKVTRYDIRQVSLFLRKLQLLFLPSCCMASLFYHLASATLCARVDQATIRLPAAKSNLPNFSSPQTPCYI